MNTGMLWFDNDPKTTLAAKIARAVNYYAKKYGRRPNLCLVHPRAMEGQKIAMPAPEARNDSRVTVRPYHPVLPGHFWIGIEEKIKND